MSNLVFVSGLFSSGTTLLFTLFRHTEGCHSLYEPLHEKLPEYLVWSPRVYEGHAFVGNYYAEYKGFSRVPDLHRLHWGQGRLYLGPGDRDDDLYRYLSYLIGTGYGKAPRVMLKENRFSFRLGWLRSTFPTATIVHVYRDLDEQWRSMVRRVQEHVGEDDVGHSRPDYMGFRLAAWCDDLASEYPELETARSTSGYERFSKLWNISRREQERYADISVGLSEVRTDFAGTCERISTAAGFELDAEQLRPYLATERTREDTRSLAFRVGRLMDRAGGRYAAARVSARNRSRPA